MSIDLVVVAGATATGKSALALDLAESCGGEIINADSMQVYRGMDIGTAKLSIAERRGIPHHLLDIWDVDVAANVAVYQRLARDKVQEITARGALPILVGGSGLYVRAVSDDLRFPGTDPEVRRRLEQECASVGVAQMHAKLAARDQEAAAAILPGNARRIVRALEVIEISGAPFSAVLPDAQPVLKALTIGLDSPREVLSARIAARVNAMFADGLVEEVANLPGLRDSPTASRALGYRQVLDLLAAPTAGADRQTSHGTFTANAGVEAAAVTATIAATRKFARRQVAWFRRDSSIHWLAAEDPELRSRANRLVAAARGQFVRGFSDGPR